MAEPENHTIRLLRDIRVTLDGMNDKMDANYSDLRQRIDNLRKAAYSESVLGQYATAELDEKIESLEKARDRARRFRSILT